MEHHTLNAVGVWFFSTSSQRYLYLMRNDPKHPGSWGLAGGKCDPGESLLDTIHRECKEEMGLDFVNAKFLPIEKWTSADGVFSYHTFFCPVDREFVPVLNHEHWGYAWIESGQWPRPMHPGLWNTVQIQTIQDKILLLEQRLESTNYYIDDSVDTGKIFERFAQH